MLYCTGKEGCKEQRKAALVYIIVCSFRLSFVGCVAPINSSLFVVTAWIKKPIASILLVAGRCNFVILLCLQ